MPKQNDQESIYQEEGTMSKKDGYSRPGLFGSVNITTAKVTRLEKQDRGSLAE